MEEPLTQPCGDSAMIHTAKKAYHTMPYIIVPPNLKLGSYAPGQVAYVEEVTSYAGTIGAFYHMGKFHTDTDGIVHKVLELAQPTTHPSEKPIDIDELPDIIRVKLPAGVNIKTVRGGEGVIAEIAKGDYLSMRELGIELDIVSEEEAAEVVDEKSAAEDAVPPTEAMKEVDEVKKPVGSPVVTEDLNLPPPSGKERKNVADHRR